MAAPVALVVFSVSPWVAADALLSAIGALALLSNWTCTLVARPVFFRRPVAPSMPLLAELKNARTGTEGEQPVSTMLKGVSPAVWPAAAKLVVWTDGRDTLKLVLPPPMMQVSATSAPVKVIVPVVGAADANWEAMALTAKIDAIRIFEVFMMSSA